MDENYVPKLTLDPAAAQAAFQEAPVEAPVEEVKEEIKVEKLDISSLSPAEQAAVRQHRRPVAQRLA